MDLFTPKCSRLLHENQNVFLYSSASLIRFKCYFIIRIIYLGYFPPNLLVLSHFYSRQSSTLFQQKTQRRQGSK